MSIKKITESKYLYPGHLLVLLCYYFYHHPMVFYQHPSGSIYHSNCKIITGKGETLFEKNGQFCDFSSDGKTLVFNKDQNKLSLYDAHQRELWNKNIEIHHALKFAEDGQSIYALSSEHHDYENRPFRFDVISKFDLKGQELHRWSLYDNRVNPPSCSTTPRIYDDSSENKNEKEFAHFDALYEIPKNALSKKYDWMMPPKIIVSMQGLNVFAIFSMDLQLLKVIPVNDECVGMFHDGQILPNGHLIYFRNAHPNSLEKSNLIEMDIETHKIVKSIAVPYSSIRGTVQRMINGHYLITESANGGRAIQVSDEGRVLWEMANPMIDKETKRPELFQTFRNRPELKRFINSQIK